MSRFHLLFLLLVALSKSAVLGQAPLVTEGKSLDELRERSQDLIKFQAEFAKGIEDGSIDRFAELRSKWPELEKQVTELTAIRQKINADEGDVDGLTKELYAKLQNLGPYLDSAYMPDEVVLHMPRLSDAQVAEINRVSDEIQGAESAVADDSGGPRMRLLGLNKRFTMLFLSVPVEIQAPPGSTVYFDSEAGGHFLSNDLAVKKVEANEQGIAQVHWISEGNASGEAGVEILSPEAVNRIYLSIRVVDLKLQLPKGFTP